MFGGTLRTNVSMQQYIFLINKISENIWTNKQTSGHISGQFNGIVGNQESVLYEQNTGYFNG